MKEIKNREHDACPVMQPLAAKLDISAVLRIRILNSGSSIL
jgi:hypothetical protein